MSNIDSFEMKCELFIAIRDVVEARHQFKDAVSSFERNGIKEGSTYMSGLDTHFEKLLRSFFDGKCRDLTGEHADGTPASVELSDDYYTFASRPTFLYRDYVVDEEDTEGLSQKVRQHIKEAEDSGDASRQVSVLCDALEYLNWDGIEDDLKSQVASLATEGYRQVASDLVRHLNMNSRWYAPKHKSGRFIFTTCSVNWSEGYRFQDNLMKINNALDIVTEKSGFNFGDAINALWHAIHELTPNNEFIPSRTSFNKGKCFGIVCFKNKYEFQFNDAAFEAIQAFVNMYGDDQAIDAVMATAELSQPKAA
ncbi:hypothetical protein [Halomonas sp. I5-271120]|uniref:hypothetical protein n=1 Tax=Halomonas sp. I5-271120 TaxID=3061632 RepID=UPI002714B181|nr:hypothetical protein [Halomonas sp. I5-271120]